jgi:predicted transcriptional regulator
MYHSTDGISSEPTAVNAEFVTAAVLDRLYGREKEVAALIFERGPSTAGDVQSALKKAISNPAVRSMLNRLVSKGILTRITYGSQRAHIYGPALDHHSIRELEIQQFAADFFDGSMECLIQAIAALVARERAGHRESVGE